MIRRFANRFAQNCYRPVAQSHALRNHDSRTCAPGSSPFSIRCSRMTAKKPSISPTIELSLIRREHDDRDLIPTADQFHQHVVAARLVSKIQVQKDEPPFLRGCHQFECLLPGGSNDALRNPSSFDQLFKKYRHRLMIVNNQNHFVNTVARFSSAS